MAAPFAPRTIFPTLTSLPRSYFLGHHRAGLGKMKTMLSSIDLVIECRDYRVPLTSRNPLFEESLAGRHRLIVYTKRDLGSEGAKADRRREEIIRRWHRPSAVLFSDHHDRRDVKKILDYAKDYASSLCSLTAARMLVVGMPNVGKSSLLNALRHVGVSKGKAAQTGAQPGITRKIASGVRIVEGDEDGEGVYLVDTPGVFVPYVPDAEAMLRLALCGSVKDTIVPPTTLADYLLYRLNLHSPASYALYHPPTNDIMTLLDAIARQTGRLQKGAVPDIEGTALWLIQRWRGGHLGRFVLDTVADDAYERKVQEDQDLGGSMNQARKAEREGRREKIRMKRREAG
ncbi:MAG: Mitochondrial GTPase [Thelocarpon superellum]|nr:MAG: Mitochondrial GTPase [Thelocarpon superellum]